MHAYSVAFVFSFLCAVLLLLLLSFTTFPWICIGQQSYYQLENVELRNEILFMHIQLLIISVDSMTCELYSVYVCESFFTICTTNVLRFVVYLSLANSNAMTLHLYLFYARPFRYYTRCLVRSISLIIFYNFSLIWRNAKKWN